MTSISETDLQNAIKSFFAEVQKDQRTEFAFMAMDSDIVASAFAAFAAALLEIKQ